MGKKYEIGDRTWVQRPLVLGQWQQLMGILKGISFTVNNSQQVIEALGTQLPLALAVVLIETDGDLGRRFGLRYTTNADGVQMPEWYQNPEVMLEIANQLHASIDAETTLQVVDDFLSCNPVSSILDKLIGMFAAALPLLASIQTKSPAFAPISPVATSPDGIESSGDIPPVIASPTAGSETGNIISESQ